MASEILIVDFGSQTTHLIGRRLHSLGAEIEYIDPATPAEEIKMKNPKGIIFSGGPASVYEEGAPTIDSEVYQLGVPIMGICYGWQLMAQQLGGEVRKSQSEYGTAEIFQVHHPLYFLRERRVGDRFKVVMSHGDSVTRLPEDFGKIGSTSRVENAAVANWERKFFGIQFHPEAHHTEHGPEILKNFAQFICGIELKPIELNPQTIIESIREKVKERKVICAVSGGVDSTVAAFLIGKAIGNNLVPVYVDSGLMRSGTGQQVEYIFSDLIDSNLIAVDARERFLNILAGVKDPERKRKRIGKLYAEIFEEESRKVDASFQDQVPYLF